MGQEKNKTVSFTSNKLFIHQFHKHGTNSDITLEALMPNLYWRPHRHHILSIFIKFEFRSSRVMVFLHVGSVNYQASL